MTKRKRSGKRKVKQPHGAPQDNDNSASHGGYMILSHQERGRALPAEMLRHLASKIRQRVRDLGVTSAVDLSVAKQDLVRRGRILDLYLSRIENAYLMKEINELPERYFTALNRFILIEHTLGYERVPLEITARGVTAVQKLRAAYRVEPEQEPHGPQDKSNSARDSEGKGKTAEAMHGHQDGKTGG